MLGKLGLNCLIFQDDIGKLNDNMDEVREGCDKIDETLKSKRLSLNYDKSKYVIIGGTKARKEILEQAKINPLTMGGVTTTMLSDPWIYDAAIIVTLRSISVVLLSLIPLRCQSCLAWQPSGARDKVSKFTFVF